MLTIGFAIKFQATLANMVKGKRGDARVKISDSPFVSTIHEQETFDNGDCYRPPKKTPKVTNSVIVMIGNGKEIRMRKRNQSLMKSNTIH